MTMTKADFRRFTFYSNLSGDDVQQTIAFRKGVAPDVITQFADHVRECPDKTFTTADFERFCEVWELLVSNLEPEE